VAEDIKTDLETYMFYYHRYESHRNAGRVADTQLRLAEDKGYELQERFLVRAADTKFLHEATVQLLANRRVLQWSYVYGYYLDRKRVAERNLFEYLQENLEKHTNDLSELYERPAADIPDYIAFNQWKENVTNYARVTEKFLKNFVDGVAKGLVQQ
jgi:ariadne-1